MANLEELLKVGIGGKVPALPQFNYAKFQRQQELEKQMRIKGVEDFERTTQNNTLNNRESITKHGQLLIKKTIEQFAQAIQADVEEKNTGRKIIAFKLIEQIRDEGKDTFEVAALLALTNVLNSLTVSQVVQKAAMSIGSAFENEARNRAFESENPAYFQAVYKNIQKKQYKHKETVMTHSMNKVNIEWEKWSNTDKLHLGMRIIGIMERSTGLITTERRTTAKNKTPVYLIATPKTIQLIEETNGKLCSLFPKYYPTLIQPKKWTSPYDGGYHTDEIKKHQFVKTKPSNYMKELANISDEMDRCYKAVNTLQDTPWRINKPVLTILETVWEQGLMVGKLPSRLEEEMPVKPIHADTKEDFKRWHEQGDNKVIWTDWKHRASKVYEKRARNRSKKLQIYALIELANKFKDEETIFFPYQLDFRGRAYPIPSYLEPQGAEYARALLEFEEGVPMGNDPKAAYWLAIHTANVYGEDKLSLDDRQKWTLDHSQEICQVASDPMGTLEFWRNADKPFMFLAACIEWSGYIKNGKNHITRLPIAIDGTCNGLQIFSLMLRDETGGVATNLLPSDKPQDIYGIVADKTIAYLENENSDELVHRKYPFTKKQVAQMWLNYGVNRKLTKRCVMIVPYSGTLHACRKYVEEYITEKLDEGVSHPFGEQLTIPTQYIAKIIWDMINATVIKAREAMEWLKHLSKLAASQNIPVNWKTPSGFRVQQSYVDIKNKRVLTKLGHKVIKLTLAEEQKTINKRRQATGISANFVHSMDAAAMMLTVLKCGEQGIKSFQMIHDSYGTHCTQIETMGRTLREVFVEMFSDNQLEKFRNDIVKGLTHKNTAKVKPIPAMGNLNIHEILKSKYFFA